MRLSTIEQEIIEVWLDSGSTVYISTDLTKSIYILTCDEPPSDWFAKLAFIIKPRYQKNETKIL